MIQEIDPIALHENLQDRVQRYLLTSLPISRRFPKLRKLADDYLSNPAADRADRLQEHSSDRR